MSTKSNRSGGKYTGSHTTIIPAAARVTDFLNKRNEVTKINNGHMKGGLKTPKQGCHVKIGYGDNGCILFQIRGNTSKQEIRVWSKNIQSTKLALAKELRKQKVNISFEKKRQRQDQ